VFAVALTVLAPATGRAQAQTFRLRVNGFVDATGTVTSSPAGISCTTARFAPVGTCGADFAAGTVVTLTAVPGEQNTFEGWTGGGCTGTGDCQVTMNQDIDVRPNFVATRYPVTIVGAGNGEGFIHEPLGFAFGSPPIACAIRNGVTLSPACTTTVAYNSVIELGFETNVAGTNQFGGFSSECAPLGGGLFPCRARITGPTTITATIVAREFRVKSAGGTGTGTVTSSNVPEINCTVTSAGVSGVCGRILDRTVSPFQTTLIATPGEGSRFVGWSGACTADPCTVFPDFPPNVPEAVARFEALAENTVKLGVNGIGGFGRGRVTSSPAGIDCDFSNPASASGTGTCLAIFPFGTPVELTATPRDGTKVLGFTGDCASEATPCTVIMYHDRSATVRLDPARFPITVTATGNGSGIVLDVANVSNGLTPPINCKVTRGVAGSGCALMYPLGSTLHLSAGITTGSSKVTIDQTTCVTSACTVTGPFTLNTTFTAPEINIVGAGNGTGRVVDTGLTGLNCTITPGGLTGSCSKVFDMDPATTASFVPIPDFGSVFVGYSGLCAGIQACTTSGDFPPNTQLVARFELTDASPIVLMVAGVGTGRGIVTAAPGNNGSTQCTFTGVVAGDACSVTYAQPTEVTLTASPQFGSTFGGWTGHACSGTDLTCTFTVSATTTVSVNFISPHSVHDLALALTGGFTLTPNEREGLDRLGNRNGGYDLGDLLAYLDRTGQKLSATDAAAAMAARPAPPAARTTRRVP